MYEGTKGWHGIWLALLAVVVIGTFAWWNRGGTELTITGKATVKAAPDEYVFYPSYESKSPDKESARAAVTTLGNATVNKLKELGISEQQLSSNVSVRDPYPVYEVGKEAEKDTFVATYALTVTVRNHAQAKQVQEYLSSTPVTGSVTPSSAFSDEQRKELERKARKLALEDAAAQAKDTSETLHVSIRGIKSIGEPTWGGPVPFMTSLKAEGAKDMAIQSAPAPELLVGEQEITYQVQVVYRVR